MFIKMPVWNVKDKYIDEQTSRCKSLTSDKIPNY